MNAENRCPACNAELAANAPRGLCPACLLKGGLGTQTGGTGGSNPSQGPDFVPPTPAELAPHFPDLEILELVGRGGMGVVYKARQKRLDRLVALKILSPKIGQDPAFAERFAREARAMAMLNHPHIVAVHDFGQTPPRSPLPPGEGQGEGEGVAHVPLYYFLMEYVDGVNLRRLLDAGKLAPEEALAIVPQICDALQYAHDAGVVHRDIKPENILLDKNGRVKIADFGLAKLVGREAKDMTLTAAGQVMGTPQYMAPEQIEHPKEVDHRADIYSLGVVFYQMLTGELPIGRFAPPSKKVQIDVRLDEVVLRALEKEPERRYQQASEIKTKVETIATSPPAVPEQTQDRSQRWRLPPLVVRRDGQRAINWPVLAVRGLVGLFAVFMTALLLFVAMLPFHSMHGGDLVLYTTPATCLIAGIGVLCVAMAIRVLRGFEVPLDQLPELDGPARRPTGTVSGSTAVSTDDVIEQARQQVQGPAIGLLVTGIFNWAVSVPLILVILYMVTGYAPPSTGRIQLNGLAAGTPSITIAIVVLGILVLSSLMIFAALKMKRLQAYGLAVVASILAIIISPSNLIGLPIGIWALVVLSQREVRAAFARNRKRATGSASVAPPNDTEHSDTLPRSTGRSGTQGGMVALVLCLAAIPLALLIGSFVPLHPAFVFGLLLLLGIITLILGIARWESGMGKAAVIMSSILTVIALWVLGVAISGVTLLVPARRIEVPVGSTAHVGADGQVEVDLPGRAKAAATAAVPDETAIQGTWEIANSTSTYMHALWTDPAVREREEEVRKTTKIVIASDILKVTGEFLPVAIYEYQLGTRGNHKIIDLRIGSRNYHGIYKLERDQLTMCVTAFAQRPSEFFAEFGSQTELLVLRRIGDAVVADDEKAIQGTWQVDSVSDGGSKSANRLTELFPMGRRAEFSHNRIIPLDFHYDPQTIITYGLDANSRPKRFDLDRQGDRCFRGGYELKGDRLTLGWEFSSKPGTFTPTSLPETLAAGHNTVLVVLKRAAATTEKTSAGDNASEKPQAKPPAVNTAAELKALQGQWKVVRVEKGKQADSAWSTGPTGDETINLAKIHLFSFFNEDDFAMLENEQSQAPVFQYKVDPTATPKTIDFRENYPDIGKGLVALGIYELDGDQLKICLARRLPALKTEHRPKSLVIENDSRDILFHLERHRTAKDQTRIQARPKPPEKLPNAAVTAEAAPGAPEAKPPAVSPPAELKALHGPWKVVRVEKGKDADSSWASICQFGSAIDPATTDRINFGYHGEEDGFDIIRRGPESDASTHFNSSGFIPAWFLQGGYYHSHSAPLGGS